MESAFVRLNPVVDALAEEVGGTFAEAVRTPMVLMRAGHESEIRKAQGIPAWKDSVLYVAELKRERDTIQAGGRNVYPFSE